MPNNFGGKMIGYLLIAICCANSLSCTGPSPEPLNPSAKGLGVTLAMMSLVDENNSEFESNVLNDYAAKAGIQFRYIPVFETVDDRLELYRELLQRRSPKPDLLEIDIIWPSLLAEHLVDLKPSLGEDIKAFPPELIQAFTVRGRLVAIPLYMNTGVLYYRSDLLKKYGFAGPPKTWSDLEEMAKVIQSGERRAGKKDFWGYVWQGQASEGLTCDALEWTSSQGGGGLLGPDRTVRVYNPNAVKALQRAVSWVNSISPPGVIAYNEDDSLNVWQAGNAAFMRNWGSVYGSLKQPSCAIREHVGVSLLPAGVGGSSRALGGIAASVSRYSDHPAEAIALLRHLTGETTERLRAQNIGGVPPRLVLQQRPELMERTAFHGALSGQVMRNVIARPSLVAGKQYAAVSRAYFLAVHSALMRQVTPDDALHSLETKLVQITGFRPNRSAP